MEKPNSVIALDFDGVIGDSLRDSFVQSVLAFRDMGGNVPDNASVEKQFRAARPLAGGAGDYYTVMRMIQGNPGIDFRNVTPKEFGAEVRRDGAVKGRRFDLLVTQHRLDLASNRQQEWFSLQRVFPGIGRLVGRLQKKHAVFIVSAKSKGLIVKLLDESGIRIPAQNILSGLSKDKAEQVRKLSQMAGVPVNRIVLVDDSLEFLKRVKKIGVEAVMAKWGYSSRAQRKQAKRAGIPLLRIPRVFGRSITLWSRLRKVRKN